MSPHRTNVYSRLELLFVTVEHSVPEEYWLLDPKPLNCIYAIDVSRELYSDWSPFVVM